MINDREIIRAALAHSFGRGSTLLQRIAWRKLRESGVGPWADPRLIALGLRASTRPVTRQGRSATVDGTRIDYLWDPDPRETGLNVFLGLAMLVLWQERMTSLPTDVYRLAGFLALPACELPHEAVIDLQIHAPAWFLEARRRGGSGTYIAIGARSVG